MEDDPYVVPIHYSFDGSQIFFFTTEGKKTRFIDKNPNVCFQIEEINTQEDWTSVIVNGRAHRITGDERENAVSLLTETNPKLSPALSIQWMDQWVRGNIEAVYRVLITRTSGRRTAERRR